MNRKILLLSLFVANIMTSQSKVENAYYNLPVPEKTNVKLFQSTHESLANIDSYQFILNGKPKYIFYMMSNKLEAAVTVGIDNYKDFLIDIGDIDIIKAEMFNDFIKVYFNYKNKKAIEGVVYIGIRNNIVNRFLLMYPNESALNIFNEEVNIMIKDTYYKKSAWEN